MVRPRKPAQPPCERKSSAGRKPYAPRPDQRRMVQFLCGCQVPQRDIAALLGISTATLNSAFRDELDRGAGVVQERAVPVVRKNLDHKNAWVRQRAAEFLLRTRFRWTERVGVDVSGTVQLTVQERERMRREILEAADRYELQREQQRSVGLLAAPMARERVIVDAEPAAARPRIQRRADLRMVELEPEAEPEEQAGDDGLDWPLRQPPPG